jgi:hypothetical protein
MSTPSSASGLPARPRIAPRRNRTDDRPRLGVVLVPENQPYVQASRPQVETREAAAGRTRHRFATDAEC